ncbi:MAG: disulfide bond formation protein DsbA, partial [Actinomycetota bacterium]
WRVMSLAIVNEGEDVPAKYRKAYDASWLALRTLVATDAAHGSDAVGRLYSAVGTRIHLDKGDIDEAMVAASLAEAGLPADLLAAATDASFDDAVRVSHAAAQDAVGTRIGTPILEVHGRAFFGPVVNPSPGGDDALALFEAVETLARVAQFSELKRGRASKIDLRPPGGSGATGRLT